MSLAIFDNELASVDYYARRADRRKAKRMLLAAKKQINAEAGR